MNFYVKTILAVAVLILAALVAMFLFASSDEAEIEDLIEIGVKAARRNDPETVIRLVSKDNWQGKESYEEIVERIRQVCEDRRVRVAQLAGAFVTVHGDEAEATFTVKGRLGPRDLGEAQVRIKLRREKDGWKVVEGERLR